MEYKVKYTGTPYRDKDTKAWNVHDFIHYFKDEYLRAFKIKTHKPKGQILAHINSKSINFLFNQIKSDEPGVDKNVLYREYVDWLFENKRTKKDGLIRVWFLSNKEIMTDFLDLRAKNIVEAKLGSDEEFERQERERREELRHYFERKDTDNGKK